MTAVAAPVALELEHVFDYTVALNPPVVFGSRMFYEALSGRVTGPRLNGDVLRGGGDWATVRPDGWVGLDVRGHTRTDDGVLLYFSYDGLLEPTPAFNRAVATGGETAFEDQYWRVSIRVETDDPRYQWLTRSTLLGRGRLCADRGVAYQVFRVG
jgi:hypothetical protein